MAATLSPRGIHAFVFESVPVIGKGERIWWLRSSRSAFFFCFSRPDHFVAISSGCRRSPRARYTRLSVMTRQIRSLPRGGELAAPAKMTFGPYRLATKVSIMETEETMGRAADEISIKTGTIGGRSIARIVLPSVERLRNEFVRGMAENEETEERTKRGRSVCG